MPKFKFLTLLELEKNFIDLKNEIIKKYYNDLNKIPFIRKQQLDALENTIAQLKQLSIPELLKSQIFTGIMLQTKADIGATYWGPWKLIASVKNSKFYTEADNAIGVNDKNILDDDSKELALNVNRQYHFLIAKFDGIKAVEIPNPRKVDVTDFLNYQLNLENSLQHHKVLMPQTTHVAKPDKRKIVSENERDYLDPVGENKYVHADDIARADRIMYLFNNLKKNLKDDQLADAAVAKLLSIGKVIGPQNSVNLHIRPDPMLLKKNGKLPLLEVHQQSMFASGNKVDTESASAATNHAIDVKKINRPNYR